MENKPARRPVGRPRSLPTNLPDIIMSDFESRMNPETCLVVPGVSDLARKLKISRATIKRIVKSLRDSGLLELEYIESSTLPGQYRLYYRIKKCRKGNDTPPKK